MYHPLLYIHSYVRWGVLILLVYAFIQAYKNITASSPEMERFGKVLSWYVILLDIQLLLGLVMYIFASPQIQHAFQDFGAAMKRTDLRFWAVEHPIIMLIVIVLGHVAKIKFKRLEDARKTFRSIALLLGISLVILLLVIPWPFSWVARPLFRF